MLIAPLPPPQGGVATWTELVLASPLSDRWQFSVINTSPRQGKMDQEARFHADRVLPSLRMVAQTAWRASRERPHVAHLAATRGWALQRAMLMNETLRNSGVPGVIHLHAGDFVESFAARPKAAQMAIRRGLARAAKVVAITRETERGLREQLGLSNVVWLPNFTDFSWLGAPRPHPRHNGPPRALFVGWMIPGKGIFDLLEAAARVPQLHLDFAGPFASADGHDVERSFRARIADLGLSGRAVHHGSLPRERLAALYQAADFMVLPTYREGFPFVVVEAMAAGLPIISTPVGAIPDLVTSGDTGFLVPCGRPDELVAPLAALANDPALRQRQGQAARCFAEKHLSAEVGLAQLEACWLDCCAQSS